MNRNIQTVLDSKQHFRRGAVTIIWTLFSFVYAGFLLSLPFAQYSLVPGNYVASLSSIVLMILLVIFLALILVEQRIFLHKQFLWDFFLLSAFVFVEFLSVSVNETVPLLEIAKLFGRIVAVYFFTSYVVIRSKNRTRIGSFIVISATVASIIALGQSLGFLTIEIGRPLDARTLLGHQSPVARSAGPYGAYGQFGMLLISALPISISFALGDRKTIFPRILSILSCVLILLGIMISQTRGVWVAAVIVVVLTFWGAMTHRGISVPTVLKLCAFLFILPLSVALGYVLVAIQPATVFERIEVYITSLQVFTSNPLLGTGYDGFMSAAAEYGVDTAIHNVFLEVLTTTGTAGFSVFLIFTLGITMRAGRILSNRSYPTLSYAFCLSLFGVLVEAQLVRGLYAYELWLIFGLVTGSYLRLGVADPEPIRLRYSSSSEGPKTIGGND